MIIRFLFEMYYTKPPLAYVPEDPRYAMDKGMTSYGPAAICYVCASEKHLFLCDKCGQTWYCSKQHQALDRRNHKVLRSFSPDFLFSLGSMRVI